MQAKEILAMEPGREMDALVAEKVMGYTTHGQFRDKDGVRVMIDRYSTDISAAWEVVDKMSKTHFSEMAMTELEDGAWGWMARFILVLNEPYTVNGYRATAKTAPEAICKAALLAVMDE
ncbi:hypothetical protein EXW96_26355 [Paenibacillus sp. JMULE4]|uniref:BC1872 family protein n=1 Tax=Paenibacillus sp. JMULE4 TaxID=2518342 RepID=UPI0015751145|nr:hypothetical protein [Paenibacillus sp. JMULE4]NTZ20912.1 hypothetical protein [Paenibacillus sp. JMULE4]